jgi:hypothetical protein
MSKVFLKKKSSVLGKVNVNFCNRIFMYQQFEERAAGNCGTDVRTVTLTWRVETFSLMRENTKARKLVTFTACEVKVYN